MIVSASYKTDIPAFYGAWFLNRLRAGFCRTVNPYGGQLYRVALGPDAVDGFVFWTKNVGPFFPALEAVRRRGDPFVVQYSVLGYPRALESSVTPADKAVDHMHRLAADYGPRVAVWRYDPVLLTSSTPVEWHVANFAALARRLEGATDEAVVSFTEFYRKTRRNLSRAAQAQGFDWRAPGDEEKRALIRDLADIAAGHGMTLTLCTQPGLGSERAGGARCIDAARLSDVAGRPVPGPQKGNRPGCLCAASRDIGTYDTCPHGCVYCYAVQSSALARTRFRAHDPDAEFLLAPRLRQPAIP